MTKPLRIGIAGLGTVGTGVVKILQENAGLVAARTGRPLEIVSVCDKDKTRDRGVDLSRYDWAENTAALAARKDVDAIVELIGGSEGVALDLVKASLSAGKSVVTANKAMLAHHGFELASLAESKGATLAYEAAVAGGIPVIKALREGLAANKITTVFGILNGTCNYILTEMKETGRGFAEVLKEAQAKGYAEADPTFDVEGVDTGHKICLLASIAFGVKPNFKNVQLMGISKLTDADIKQASASGCKIKLLGIAKQDGGKIDISVQPCLVPEHSLIGAVDGVLNAVFIQGDFVDCPVFVGRGAGERPTASAVVGDLVDIARGIKVPTFGIPAKDLKDAQFMEPKASKEKSCLMRFEEL